MTDTKCGAKHTKPQIPDEDWRCPRCHADFQGKLPNGKQFEKSDGRLVYEGWIIEEPAEGGDPDCELLHEDDTLACANCNHVLTGKAFARQYAKKKNLVPCPTCHGKGVVLGKKAGA